MLCANPLSTIFQRTYIKQDVCKTGWPKLNLRKAGEGSDVDPKEDQNKILASMGKKTEPTKSSKTDYDRMKKEVLDAVGR